MTYEEFMAVCDKEPYKTALNAWLQHRKDYLSVRATMRFCTMEHHNYSNFIINIYRGEVYKEFKEFITPYLEKSYSVRKVNRRRRKTIYKCTCKKLCKKYKIKERTFKKTTDLIVSWARNIAHILRDVFNALLDGCESYRESLDKRHMIGNSVIPSES